MSTATTPHIHIGPGDRVDCGPTSTGCVTLHIGEENYCFSPETACWLADALRKSAWDELASEGER